MADAIVAAAQPDECGVMFVSVCACISTKVKARFSYAGSVDKSAGDAASLGLSRHARILRCTRPSIASRRVSNIGDEINMPWMRHATGGSNTRAGLRALNVKDSGRFLPEPD